MPLLPDWVIPTTSTLGILASLITGFAKGWLWTKTQVDRVVESYEDKAKLLDAERLEWKALAMESLGVVREVNTTMDAVLQGLAAQRSLLEALRDTKAGAGHG